MRAAMRLVVSLIASLAGKMSPNRRVCPGWLIARRVAGCAAALAALIASSVATAQQAPRRIVSFNLCADQLVLALADPEQVAGLSPYAADPSLSVMARAANGFPRLEWQAESIVSLNPDLVLVGSWDRSVTQRILAKLGYRVAEIELVRDIASARRQIVEVAALLGHRKRGEHLLAALDAARGRLAGRARTPFTTALVIERGGYAAGSASLAAALLAEAGLRAPPGAPAGYGAFVPLERLIMLKPDLVVIKDPPREPGDQGALYLTHPALRALYPPERRMALPTRFTLCGGPALVAALNYLADTLAQMHASTR